MLKERVRYLVTVTTVYEVAVDPTDKWRPRTKAAIAAVAVGDAKFRKARRPMVWGAGSNLTHVKTDVVSVERE